MYLLSSSTGRYNATTRSKAEVTTMTGSCHRHECASSSSRTNCFSAKINSNDLYPSHQIFQRWQPAVKWRPGGCVEGQFQAELHYNTTTRSKAKVTTMSRSRHCHQCASSSSHTNCFLANTNLNDLYQSHQFCPKMAPVVKWRPGGGVA